MDEIVDSNMFAVAMSTSALNDVSLAEKVKLINYRLEQLTLLPNLFHT